MNRFKIPNYIDISIICSLLLVCGILLCVMYCKWRNERILNRNMSARASQHEITEEQRSLSGERRPELLPDSSVKTMSKQQSLNIGILFYFILYIYISLRL